MTTKSAKSARNKITINSQKTANVNDRFISSVTHYQNNYGSYQPQPPKSPILYMEGLSDTTTIPALANFLKVYFDFVYFLLACPFRIGLDERGKFFIKKWRPQMVNNFF